MSQIEVQKITFDLSNKDFTKVSVEAKHNDPNFLPLKNYYEKMFPATIPVVDILTKWMFTETEHYLFW